MTRILSLIGLLLLTACSQAENDALSDDALSEEAAAKVMAAYQAEEYDTVIDLTAAISEGSCTPSIPLGPTHR